MKSNHLKKKVVPAVLAASIAFAGLALPAKNVLANEEVVRIQQQLMEAPTGLSKQEILYSFLGSQVGAEGKARATSVEATEQFSIIEEKADSKTNTYHFKTQEMYQGIPVYASQQTIALDKDNNVISFIGDVNKDLSRSIIPTEPSLTTEEAETVAKESIEAQIGEVSSYDGVESELIIYPSDAGKRLAYLVKASTSIPAPGYFHYFVDATSGEVLHNFDAVAALTPALEEDENAKFTPLAGGGTTPAPRALPIEYVDVTAKGMDIFGKLHSFNAVKDASSSKHFLYDGTRGKGVHTFKANRMPETSFILLSGLLGLTGFEVESNKNFFYDPAAVSAHINASKTFDYFKNIHGRNSLDNNGMKLVSTVHIGDKWNNAAWNGKQMLYGDGDGQRMISLSGGLDVIAHEMTHGVIEKTTNLIYENESGAINESIADIFGAFAENKTGEGLWLLGEDIWTPGIQGDALRSMSDPGSVYIGGYTEDGYYPDHYDKRYLGELDRGGVHINSSINNKAAQLITDGGTHYGVTVNGIGKARTEKIFYRALTLYLTPSSGFAEMRQAAIQAARDLHPDRNGAPSLEVQAVMAAYDAIGVY
ncbi:M4 family metallopeptidase [Sutcliffiella horikoshii]|uniref:M4 family metallopeptidase n=1 Tax=Sutcliffiella horikoshii TaxID=79883 RepID=UPI003CEA4ABA